ncbi:hypothetical protein GCM10027416_01870 [Okibacterium endophyticum]
MEPTPGPGSLGAERLPAYYIASVGRALTLLSVANQRRLLTVSEAAEILDVAPSTAHRLLQMLVYHGYIKQNDSRAYVPRSTAFVHRHGWATSAQYGQPRGKEILTELAEVTDGTAHIVTLEGNSIRFLAGVESSRGGAGMATTRVGWLLPAHATAGGRAILAGLPDHKLDELYPDGLPATRSCALRTVEQLRDYLVDVRRHGYALSRAAHESIGGMGVSLPDDDGPSQSAVTVGWPPEKYPAGKTAATVRHLRTAARRFAEHFS